MSTNPTCPCGSQEFRANVRIPADVHVSPQERTLEVRYVSSEEIEWTDLACYECGSSTGDPLSPSTTALAALADAQAAVERVLAEGEVMQELMDHCRDLSPELKARISNLMQRKTSDCCSRGSVA